MLLAEESGWVSSLRAVEKPSPEAGEAREGRKRVPSSPPWKGLPWTRQPVFAMTNDQPILWKQV